MGFDLLGQLCGKEKRRQMERDFGAQVAGLAKPVQVALPIIGSRLAAVGLASILGAAIKGGIPHDAQGLSAVVGTVFGAVMLAAPDAFQASGLVRAVSPSTASLYGAAAAAVKTTLAAPANARKAALSSAVQDELRVLTPTLVTMAAQQVLGKTGQYGQSNLSGQSQPSGQTMPSDQSDMGSTAGSAAVAAAESCTETDDAAVTLTGGNQ